MNKINNRHIKSKEEEPILNSIRRATSNILVSFHFVLSLYIFKTELRSFCIQHVIFQGFFWLHLNYYNVSIFNVTADSL